MFALAIGNIWEIKLECAKDLQPNHRRFLNTPSKTKLKVCLKSHVLHYRIYTGWKWIKSEIKNYLFMVYDAFDFHLFVMLKLLTIQKKIAQRNLMDTNNLYCKNVLQLLQSNAVYYTLRIDVISTAQLSTCLAVVIARASPSRLIYKHRFFRISPLLHQFYLVSSILPTYDLPDYQLLSFRWKKEVWL